MKRATLLTALVGLILALTASVAVAAVINGGGGNDVLAGTNQRDVIDGGAGNDRLYGKGGNDTLKGAIGSDILSGSTGADELIGGLSGNDEAYGAGGNDTIKIGGDAGDDYAFCGGGLDDTAHVSPNDFVDNTAIDTLALNPGLSCEHIFVNGVPLPNV
jgi:serralysin